MPTIATNIMAEKTNVQNLRVSFAMETLIPVIFDDIIYKED